MIRVDKPPADTDSQTWDLHTLSVTEGLRALRKEPWFPG